MREFKALGAFTRGSESLAHFFAMLQASLVRLIVGCALFGLVVSAAWTLVEMGPARRHLVQYATLSVQERFVGVSSFFRVRASSTEDVGRLREAFGGRSMGFLARQVAVRALCAAVVVLPGVVLILVILGRYIARDRHLRGARLIDTTTWVYRNRRRIHAVGVGAVGAVGGAALAALAITGPRGLVALPTLFSAWLALRSSWVSALLVDDANRVWHAAFGQRAMLPASESYALAAQGMGVHVAMLAVASVVAGAGGAGAAVALHRRYVRRKDGEEEGLLQLGGIPIPRKRETQHFALIGDIGSGKSVAMTPMLHGIRLRGQRAFLWQFKMEYICEFFRPGHDILLNPLDLRSAPWTPWGEIQTQADYLAMGKSLFPESTHHDKFWSVAGASLFASITERMFARGRPHPKELAYELTHASLEEMHDSVRDTMGQRYLDEHAAQMSASLLATLTSQLESFRFLRDMKDGEEPFSIKRYIEEDSDRWLFVSMAADQEAIRPLVSMWLDIAINATLSLTDNDQSLPAAERRIFAVLDEMPALQVLPSLAQGLTAGRSKGLSALLGLQSFEQVKATYGVHQAKSMLGQAQTKLYTRTSDGETARWLKDQLGSAEVEQSTESQQMGADSQRDGVSVQRSIRQRDLVLASEIQTLPDLTGILRTVDRPLLKVRYTWQPGREDPQEEMVPAPEPEPPRPPPWGQARKHLQRAQQLAGWGEYWQALNEARKGHELAHDEKVEHDADQVIEHIRQKGPESLAKQAEEAHKLGELPTAVERAEQALQVADENDTESLVAAWKVVRTMRGQVPRWEQGLALLEKSKECYEEGDSYMARLHGERAEHLMGTVRLMGLDEWMQELRGRMKLSGEWTEQRAGGEVQEVEEAAPVESKEEPDDSGPVEAVPCEGDEVQGGDDEAPSGEEGGDEMITFLRPEAGEDLSSQTV